MSPTRLSPRSPAVAWTDQPIVLFHGTISSAAEDILRRGVDLSKGRGATDFGCGFYTTTHAVAAITWSKRVARNRSGVPGMLKITLGRRALAQLEGIVFVRSSADAEDFWSFVAHCRAGNTHRPDGTYYDVAYGPVVKGYWKVAEYRVWEDYDQVSFHTPAAQDMLNNKEVCTVEVIA
jgi:hypothetical protein